MFAYGPHQLGQWQPVCISLRSLPSQMIRACLSFLREGCFTRLPQLSRYFRRQRAGASSAKGTFVHMRLHSNLLRRGGINSDLINPLENDVHHQPIDC